MDAFARVACLVLHLVIFINGFNIDTKFAVFKEIENSAAFFGYSVSQHSRSNDSNPVFQE